ncbi:hypothetical protein DBR42_18440, partial [Pelomonas sp. HMWF004]
MTSPHADLITALQARPDDADRLMRTACAELLTQPAPLLPPDAAALQAGLDRIAPGLEVIRQRLVDDAPQGSSTDALAALLRPPELAWDEAQQIDWAVRHWQACRAAGALDEELGADFGEYWRRVEWSGLRLHLARLATLGEGHADERRLLAYAVKVSARYVALGTLKR